MANTAELKELVARMPELGSGDSKSKRSHTQGKLDGPAWAEARKVYDQVLAGGAECIAGIIDMLREVDDGSDYKARYVLHAIATYVCRPGGERQRAMVATALARQLGGDRPKAVQGFVIRQLQFCGDGQVADTLGKLLADKELCEPAAMALTAIGDSAARQLRTALSKAKGPCRLTIIQNLGAARDADSAPALRKALTDKDGEVRLAAASALAGLGDAESADALLALADAKGPAWQRIRATGACLQLAANLTAAGKRADATKIYKHLRDTRTDESEAYIRQAAENALA